MDAEKTAGLHCGYQNGQQRPRTMGSEKTDHFMEMALPHLDSAYNIAFWLMRDKSSAEDVVQEALLRALTYFQSFDGRNARAWLLQIVRNTAYATLRQRHPAGTVFLDEMSDAMDARTELADPAANPEMQLIQDRDCQQLQDLLMKLPLELRDCVVLKELEGLSYKEIAAITEVPIGTVMSRLWRARQLLMKSAGEDKSA